MTDEIADILRKHLSFKNDPALRRWLLEQLDFSEKAESLGKITANLIPSYEDFSRSTELLPKAPYCALLLCHAYYKWADYLEAAKLAGDAITLGFGSGNEPQNHVISLWLRALTNEKTRHIEDAWQDTTDAIKVIEREIDDCKRRSNKQDERNEYERLVKLLHETGKRLQEEFQNSIPSFRPPPQNPNRNPKSTSSGKGSHGNGNGRDDKGGTGNGGEKTPTPLPAPTIEVNIPIDITLSNLMKAAMSSEVEAPVNVSAVNNNEIESPIDVSAINVNDVESINNADAMNLNMALPLEKFQITGTDMPFQEGEVIAEMLLPWLPDFINVAAQANPDGNHLHLDSPQKVPTAISHIIIEDRVCAIHAVKKTTSKIDRIIKLAFSKKYAWIKVTGDSMKNFDPPIEECDYVLCCDCETPPPEIGDDRSRREISVPPDDNVVVVSEADETKGGTQILVKQYRKIDNLLYSYNYEKNYEACPPCEQCRIVGIVVAVAKPNNREEKN